MKCPYLIDKSCPIISNDLTNIHICNGFSCDKPVYVYIIRCKDNTYYTGFTRNLKRRINEHKTKKGAKWVKSHGFRDYTYIQCEHASDGLRIEKYIKKKWSPEKKAKLFEIYGYHK